MQQRTGYLARLVSEPAWLMSRAPTTSPMSALRLGATLCMRSSRYVCSLRQWHTDPLGEALQQAWQSLTVLTSGARFDQVPGATQLQY